MPQFHVSAPRGEDIAPRSVLLDGRFGRMFRNLPAFVPSEEALEALALGMLEAGAGQDSLIPAGYTYLGQFIDHDITFDPVSSLQRLDDPEGLHNFRTPRLDLDSLYGRGPNNDPFLYDPDPDKGDGRTSFLLGTTRSGERDLPRNALPDVGGVPQGRALIGDPRNDENVIVGQLHLLFLLFHNKVVEQVRAEQPNLDGDQLFAEAQRVVRWHYQWIVVHDFLAKRIVGPNVVNDIVRDKTYEVLGGPQTVKRIRLQFYEWKNQPFMPVEFSVAAYRFGHSMIRGGYGLNPEVKGIPLFTSGPLKEEHQDLRGFRPLASQWTIDWSFFFELDDGANLQRARKIDSRVADPLGDVPGTTEPHALAERNLRRGRALKLPSGQAVARAMGIEPLSDEQLALPPEEFAGRAPLWFYVLKEAEILGSGEKLGPVGGRIVAEVLLGLLKGDSFSFINVEPNWTPTLGATGDFDMADLVRFTLGEGGSPPGSGWQA